MIPFILSTHIRPRLREKEREREKNKEEEKAIFGASSHLDKNKRR
jgi:hypothetical protein